MRRTLSLTVAAGLLALGAAPFIAPAAQAASTGTVTVVHGIPGVDVDVYVDGKDALPDFKPGTVTAPLTLPSGPHEIKIFKTGQGPSGTPVIAQSVTLPAGANVSLVAHLTASGSVSPTLAVFVNDTAPIAAGKGRVTVRHVAAAPAVKVTADGATLIASLSNPDQATATVPAKTYTVGVAAASGGADVFSGPLPVAAGADTIVYAYGSLADKTFAVATQKVSGLAAAPTAVSAGGGADAPAAPGFPVWALVLVAAAAIGALASGGRLVAARTRR